MLPMRYLLVNDDGIEAPGLAALNRMGNTLGTATVVAPDRQYSACGHQATTKTVIPVSREAPDRYRVSGTPVDCVRIGLSILAPDTEIVLAGINPGGNLGVDIFMSGTAAAAREAALLGRPAMALSHYLSGAEPDWDLATARLEPVVRKLLEHPLEAGAFWNVNLPHPPTDARELEMVFCEPDDQPLQVLYAPDGDAYRYVGDYHSRPRTPGRDVDVCFGGRITVSKITTRP